MILAREGSAALVNINHFFPFVLSLIRCESCFRMESWYLIIFNKSPTLPIEKLSAERIVIVIKCLEDIKQLVVFAWIHG